MKNSNEERNTERIKKGQVYSLKSFDFYVLDTQNKNILNSDSKLSDCEFDSCLRNFDEDTLITI